MHWVHSRTRGAKVAQLARWKDIDTSTFAEKTGIDRAILAAAQRGFAGKIVTPYDPDYNQDRALSNPRFDAYPSIILYCVTETDVALALNVAWGGSADFTVRSGGHSTAGFSAGSGMLIDVSGLNDVHVDARNLLAHVGAGCNFAKLTPTLQQYGLHLPVGDCPDVCVAGYMQGGGYSFTSRSFGMQCDNVRSVRVMLSDGRIVVANSVTNHDLFWAVCGGTGGNFGVLLSVTFRLRALGQIMGFSYAWPLDTAANRALAAQALVGLQQDFLGTAPSDMTPQMIFCWQGPSQTTQVPTMLCRGTWVGTRQSGLAAIAGIGKLPGAQFQYATMGDFPTINAMLLTTPYEIPPFPPSVTTSPPEDKQARYVARDLTLAEYGSMLDWFVTSPNIYTAMCFEVAGGAINALPIHHNAFIHRTAQYSAFLDVFWLTPADEAPARAFLKAFTTMFETFWNNEVYQNYANIDVPDYRANYWGSAYYTLLHVKAKYDPDAFFNFPQAITLYPIGDARRAEAGVDGPPLVMKALAEPIEVAHAAPAKLLEAALP